MAAELPSSGQSGKKSFVESCNSVEGRIGGEHILCTIRKSEPFSIRA